jgi:hypothetical protein
MKYLTDPLFKFLVVTFSLLCLFAVAVLNRNTPFRGEHWAMLYAFVKSPTWTDKFHNMINIEYFGDHRFQPLNSLPMLIEYLVWGASFFWYYAVSILLHVFYAVSFIKLLDLLRHGPNTTPLKSLIQNYAFEFSLFLVLFPSQDVLFWTYFHYIQIAAVLATFSVFLYLKNLASFNPQKALAYILIASSTLFYEPMMIILVLFLALNFLRWMYFKSKIILYESVPGLIYATCVGSQYFNQKLSSEVTIPPNVSVLNGIHLMTGHDALFTAPYAQNKILFCLYNFVLMLLNLFRGSFLPSTSHKVNIYEFQNSQFLLGSSLPYAVLVFFLVISFSLYLIVKNKASFKGVLLPYSLLSAATLFIFWVICWGRPGAGNYSSVQFRYAFVLLPFIFAILLDFIFRFTARYRIFYSALLIVLMGINLGSSLNQGMRLEKNMSALTHYVNALKARGVKSDEIVLAVAKSIHDYTLRVPGDDVFLIYNGRGGLTKFYGKL